MKFEPWLKVYGDASYRGDCPKETAEQITFFNKLRRAYPDSLGLIAIHPRNEGKKSHAAVMKEKAEGMTKGASDIIIPGCPAFVCELKRRDHTLSGWETGQREYLKAAQDNGAFVCVALGWEAAWQALQDWKVGLKKATTP